MTVLLCNDIDPQTLNSLLARYSLKIQRVDDGTDIPGSFWQPPEAGLIKDTLFYRNDTPVHSALHETCHYVCMDQQRRDTLHTDAGGSTPEENAVCYLQILLSDFIPEMKRKRMFEDMDSWGYSFRLGSANRWFTEDAEDAYEWLIHHGLITETCDPVWTIRTN